MDIYHTLVRSLVFWKDLLATYKIWSGRVKAKANAGSAWDGAVCDSGCNWFVPHLWKLLYSSGWYVIAACYSIPLPEFVLQMDYNDVIMDAMASQMISRPIVYSTVYSGTYQRKYQSSASLAFVRGNSLVTGEFPAQRASNAENISIWWRHPESIISLQRRNSGPTTTPP